MDETLRKWAEAKRKLDILEKKIQKYKGEIGKEMNKRDVNTVSAGGFTVVRRRTTRTSLSKDTVPAEIWKQYSTRSSFDVFVLSENKGKK